MMRTGPPYTKAVPASFPGTIYDLPKEFYENDPSNPPEDNTEDELILESIAHPQASTLAINAQKRVCILVDI